jgi:hypothetical protein
MFRQAQHEANKSILVLSLSKDENAPMPGLPAMKART